MRSSASSASFAVANLADLKHTCCDELLNSTQSYRSIAAKRILPHFNHAACRSVTSPSVIQSVALVQPRVKCPNFTQDRLRLFMRSALAPACMVRFACEPVLPRTNSFMSCTKASSEDVWLLSM